MLSKTAGKINQNKSSASSTSSSIPRRLPLQDLSANRTFTKRLDDDALKKVTDGATTAPVYNPHAIKKQRTSFNHLCAFIDACGGSDKLLVEIGLPKEALVLERDGYVNTAILVAWAKAALVEFEQKLASFRDTYVPNLFTALDARGIRYDEDAKQRLRTAIHDLRAQLKQHQKADPSGANPLLYVDVKRAIQNVPAAWSSAAKGIAQAVHGVASGHRSVTLLAVPLKDVSYANGEVSVTYRVTKGDDPNFTHILRFKGETNPSWDSPLESNVVFWLHVMLKRRGFAHGVRTDFSTHERGHEQLHEFKDADSVNGCYDTLFTLAGYPKDFFTAHSTRSGYLSEFILHQVRRGTSAVDLSMATTHRWKPNSKHLPRYFKTALLRAVNTQALQGVGVQGGVENLPEDDTAKILQAVHSLRNTGVLDESIIGDPQRFHGIQFEKPDGKLRDNVVRVGIGALVHRHCMDLRPTTPTIPDIAFKNSVSTHVYKQLIYKLRGEPGENESPSAFFIRKMSRKLDKERKYRKASPKNHFSMARVTKYLENIKENTRTYIQQRVDAWKPHDRRVFNTPVVRGQKRKFWSPEEVERLDK